MGPGGDGVQGVRPRDGASDLPDSSRPAPVRDAEQPVAPEGKPSSVPHFPLPGGINDGFGSFAPTEPAKPKTGRPDRIFLAALRWFTDGIIQTVGAVFNGLLNPVEVLGTSQNVLIVDKIGSRYGYEGWLTEELGAEGVAGAVEMGGYEVFVPDAISVDLYWESAFAL